MAATTSKIRMKFRCDQDIDNMAIGADGKRFCEMCQKSLVDFRQMPLAKVKEYTSQNEGCGIFKSEHVAPDEVMLFSFASFRKYFLAMGTFLMAETAYSQDTDSTFTNNFEKIDFSKIDTVVKHRSENNQIIVQSVSKKAVKHQKNRKFEYGLFLTRRFPFVRFRYRKIQSWGGYW